MVRTLTAVLTLVILSGCAKSVIVTRDPRARIYVDGEFKGIGEAKLTKQGLPHTAQVVVKTRDGRRTRMTIKREFTWRTALGILLYGTGLIWGWEYPDSTIVDLPEAPPVVDGHARWDRPPDNDPWLKPP